MGLGDKKMYVREGSMARCVSEYSEGSFLGRDEPCIDTPWNGGS